MRMHIAMAAGLVLAACANPITRYSAQKQVDDAVAARDAGDWRSARDHWAKAIRDADRGESDTHALAADYYEYGRASGVLCDWPEAERGLMKSLEIDRSINGPTYVSLVELGRLNFARQNYGAAREYFGQANRVFEAMDAKTMDPLGYAQFLDEYSASIAKSNDGPRAAEHRARAKALRASAGAGANITAPVDRTPYGTQCAAPGS